MRSAVSTQYTPKGRASPRVRRSFSSGCSTNARPDGDPLGLALAFFAGAQALIEAPWTMTAGWISHIRRRRGIVHLTLNARKRSGAHSRSLQHATCRAQIDGGRSTSARAAECLPRLRIDRACRRSWPNTPGTSVRRIAILHTSLSLGLRTGERTPLARLDLVARPVADVFFVRAEGD